MLRYTLVLPILFIGCMPKKDQKNQAHEILNDTIAKQTDSISLVTKTPKIHSDSIIAHTEKEILSEHGYIIEDTEGRLYDACDFPLDVDSIKTILGDNLEVITQNLGGDRGSDSFTRTTINYQNTEIAYNDKIGFRYDVYITTDKLSVFNGVKIGMDKMNFINTLKFFKHKKAENVYIFTVKDNHGSMTFSFQADNTLYLIAGYYE